MPSARPQGERGFPWPADGDGAAGRVQALPCQSGRRTRRALRNRSRSRAIATTAGSSITVDDDGPGIPANQREDVFKPFFRLDDARNQDKGGTGLGLAIARDIARSHGGEIMLGDSPMGGLRATVRVPV